MSITDSLLTVKDYISLPDSKVPTELVRGKLVQLEFSTFMHGVYCCNVASLLGNHVDQHDLGWVLTNDSGVITTRDPDTVRGADVAFYSYAAVPKDDPPEKYAPNPPELVIEVKSQDDRWPRIQEKVAEYLQVGVQMVGVLDPESETLLLYHANRLVESLGLADTFKAPDILGALEVKVERFFQ